MTRAAVGASARVNPLAPISRKFPGPRPECGVRDWVKFTRNSKNHSRGTLHFRFPQKNSLVPRQSIPILRLDIFGNTRTSMDDELFDVFDEPPKPSAINAKSSRKRQANGDVKSKDDSSDEVQ